MNSYNKLERIASLIGEVETVIEKQIDRRNIGAFIASEVFDIVLEKHRNIAYDGRFRSGEHQNKSVHVKWYGTRKPTSRHQWRPPPRFLFGAYRVRERVCQRRGLLIWCHTELITKLRVRNQETGLVDSTIMRNKDWDEARVMLTEEQKNQISIFSIE